MEEIEEARKALKDAEQKIEQEKKRLEEVKKELDKKKKEAEQELEELKKKRMVLAEKIPQDVYNNYMETLEKTNGLAVVEAKDEVCLGCYMSIPPQLYVELKTEDRLQQCPQCGRFLYRK
jgi:predicted  nucleic acid-binding Zn-ribbon protein